MSGYPMPPHQPCCCLTCPSYRELDGELSYECNNPNNPWYGIERLSSSGYLCPDHPINVALLKTLTPNPQQPPAD